MTDVIRMPQAGDLAIRYVNAEQIDAVWGDIFHMIEPACDETLTPRDVYTAITAREALVWLVLEGGEPLACAVTRQHERHGNRWLDVMTIGGKDWQKWAPLLHHEFDQHARRLGCDAVTAHVRRGLEKWLARLGWRVRQVHMEYRTDG